MYGLGSVLRQIFPWWAKYYHRLEVRGLENLPQTGTAIIAPNHSGGFDYDNFCLMSAFETLPYAHPLRRKLWLLYDDRSVVQPNIWSRWVRHFTPIPVNITHKGGINYPLVDKAVERGDWIGIMPEGHSAAVYEGYRLWRFFPGVIKLHLRYKIPIIPTAMIGFVKAVQKVTQVYHPDRIPAFSHQQYLPLIFPRKLIIHFGTPLQFPEFFDHTPDKAMLFRLANIVRGALRKEIDRYIPNTSWKHPYGL
jgi:1-acyl-sn-glycerol-3-phosphate acyltransferase